MLKLVCRKCSVLKVLLKKHLVLSGIIFSVGYNKYFAKSISSEASELALEDDEVEVERFEV